MMTQLFIRLLWVHVLFIHLKFELS